MNNFLTAQPSNTTLAEIALSRMKRAILSCELSPGSKLKVDVLSKEYGLSSSPIREALNRLAQEGIVRASDNKGFRVAPISIQEFQEISRLRSLLECEALSDAMDCGDDAWEGNVLAAFHRLSVLEKRLKTGPMMLNDDWSERHKAFHFSLFSACPSSILLEMTNSLFDRAERYRRYSALYREAPRNKNNDHQALMKVALSRDKEKAIALLRKHINGTLENVTEALERQKAALQ